MGKKHRKFITLSEVDHKLQFINVVAVIGNINPRIFRGKLIKVELSLLDETVNKPGFNVILQMKSETLNQFLNVAKRGFIIQLCDIKVTKNEGEVYGVVQEEEEITFYKDDLHVQKWYPGEKPTTVTDKIASIIQSMVKWKKVNLKLSEMLPEDDEDQTKTRRSGLGSEGKNQSSPTEFNKITTIKGASVSKNITPKVKGSNEEERDNFFSLENKSKGSPLRKNKLEISAKKNEPTNCLRANKSLTSSGKVESPNTSSSSMSPRPSRVTRGSTVTNIRKASSLSSLNKNMLTRTLNRSLSFPKLNKSVVLSKLNKSESQISLNESKNLSRRKKLSQHGESRGEDSESDSVRSTRLNRSDSKCQVKKISLSSDSDSEKISSKQACSSTSRISLRKKTSDPTAKLSKLENNTIKELRSKRNVVGESIHTSMLRKVFRKKNSITGMKEGALGNDSPVRKKPCISHTDGLLSDTNSEASPNHIRKSLGKNPALNSSDSTISDSSNSSVKNIIHSRESLNMKKREYHEIENFPKILSEKKLKLNQEIGPKKNECFKPTPKINLSNAVNDEELTKTAKESETHCKADSNKKNSEIVSGKGLLNKGETLGPDFKIIQNRPIEGYIKYKEGEKIKNLRKKASFDVENECIESKSPKTRNQVLDKCELNENLKNKQTRQTTNIINSIVRNSRESEKGGVYETYLKLLTKKLNFTSVDDVIDVSLYDLDEVDVPEKFDLQCKVVSQFLLVEEGIQIVRVQDGTTCKCGTLKIPQGPSWDVVLKEILENPTVEEKSKYIDIIVFDYYRLEFPIVPGKFFRINNLLAVKFQLKQDPRQGKKSRVELFFCVKAQDANIHRLYKYQIKEMYERLTAVPLKSSLPTSVIDEVTVEKPSSDLDKFKLPTSPKMDSGSIKPVIGESGSGHRKRKSNDSNSEIESEITTQRGGFLAENKTKNKILSKNAEICKKTENSDNTNQSKMNTTNSSDETMMGETPPLLREISEIMHEESALGLPLTSSEDVHLKNSGSEVTFSQFCEGAKQKGNNFRTSTQNMESDVLRADIQTTRKLNDLSKDFSETNEEDSSKMEPLVYCPSGSSASSPVCGSPDKGKSRELQGLPHCSASSQGTQVKVISELKPSNSESRNISNDNKSVLSNSSSINVISSNTSEGGDCEILGSKDMISNEHSIKIMEVELSESPEVEELQSEVPKQTSLSPRKIPTKSNDKESNRVTENGYTSDSVVNKEKTNNEIEIFSDNSSNPSLLDVENNTTMKPVSSFNEPVNVRNDLPIRNLEEFAKRIPDRCFYKSTTEAPTLTERELNMIYDDESNPVKYFSYCYNRDLPMLTLGIVEKIKNTNSVTAKVILVSISPSFKDSWQESCIKARCPSCDKLYDVYNAAYNKNNENVTSTAAISVGSHIVCPDSQCCNQILGNPEFHFNVDFKLEDGTPLTALLAGKNAEDVFGCSAQEAIRNETALNRVGKILEKISKAISDEQPTKVVVKREDICNPKSGPLCLAQVGV